MHTLTSQLNRASMLPGSVVSGGAQQGAGSWTLAALNSHSEIIYAVGASVVTDAPRDHRRKVFKGHTNTVLWCAYYS
jgi:hypothetical protein